MTNSLKKISENTAPKMETTNPAYKIRSIQTQYFSHQSFQ